MRALLDVNVLIALLDAGHQQHSVARAWLMANSEVGWASCPLTQNGCVRILSQPSYPNPIPTSVALVKLASACAAAPHQFWPDDVSILNDKLIRADRVHGPRQLTDLYLLTLSVHHGGRFVTFDGAIATNAVRRAAAKHLLVI